MVTNFKTHWVMTNSILEDGEIHCSHHHFESSFQAFMDLEFKLKNQWKWQQFTYEQVADVSGQSTVTTLVKRVLNASSAQNLISAHTK